MTVQRDPRRPARLRPDRVGHVPGRRLHRGLHLPRRLRHRAASRSRAATRPSAPSSSIAQRARRAAAGEGGAGSARLLREHFFAFEDEIRARPVQPLGRDLREADRAAEGARRAHPARLPGKDCGACGAPDCATLAEDVVRGEATLDDCVFVQIGRLEDDVRGEGGTSS
ncbi:MAG: hypothetical protein MZW92_20480 [Comamonadaceae bacterium]|nr:hypothetical protein [Comamonadaceae bacterium]